VPLVPVPLGLAPTPICSPPKVSIKNITPYCVDQPYGIAGVTWVEEPPGIFPDSGGLLSCSYDQYHPNNFQCAWGGGPFGPQNQQVQLLFCTVCGSPNANQVYVCLNGYSKDDDGNCMPINSKYGPDLYPYFCAPGSHYDNYLQNCVGDATNQLTSPCPAGFPYYDPTHRLCYAQAQPEVFSCQPFTVQLGDCSVAPKQKQKQKSCKPQACPVRTSWNPSSCSCQ